MDNTTNNWLKMRLCSDRNAYGPAPGTQQAYEPEEDDDDNVPDLYHMNGCTCGDCS